MHKRITFKGHDHSDAIEKFINKHLEKVENFLKNEPTPVYIEVVVSQHDTHPHHRVSLQVKSPHYDQFTECEAPDIYYAATEVIDRMHRQLRAEKGRIVDSHKHGCDKETKLAFFNELGAPEEQQ